ncbi:MAG: Ig-like domain-containing protein [Bacilli bacterium]|nr:Ig-like domain-containing protein [Bacilli bacterium]
MYTDYVDYNYDDENNDSYNNDFKQKDSDKIKKIAFIVLIFAIVVLLVIFILKLVNKSNNNDDIEEESKSQLVISKDTLSLEVGQSYRLEAVYSLASSKELDLNWESNNENVATVNDEGLVTGMSEGTAEITVFYKKYKQTCVVTITPNENSATGISLGDDITLKLNDSMLLQVNVIPDDATLNDNYIYESDNEEIVSVDENGYMYANSVGSANVIVKAENSKLTDTVKVVVESLEDDNQVTEPTKIVLIGLADILKEGNSSQIVYEFYPNEGVNKNLTWESSDSNIAVVSNTGYVTGINVGKCVITATTVDGTSSSIEIEVKESKISVQSVAFKDGKSLSIKVKGTKLLSYTITPENATNKKVTFKSSDSSIVKVDSNGLIAGIKKGKANITITTDDGSKTATIAITVN